MMLFPITGNGSVVILDLIKNYTNVGFDVLLNLVLKLLYIFGKNCVIVFKNKITESKVVLNIRM